MLPIIGEEYHGYKVVYWVGMDMYVVEKGGKDYLLIDEDLSFIAEDNLSVNFAELIRSTIFDGCLFDGGSNVTIH
jgi:hypothetical protein